MGSLLANNKEDNKKTRKILIDLLSTEKIEQNYCGNSIKTTRYTM